VTYITTALHFQVYLVQVTTKYQRLQFRIRIRTYNLQFENSTFI